MIKWDWDCVLVIHFHHRQYLIWTYQKMVELLHARAVIIGLILIQSISVSLGKIFILPVLCTFLLNDEI